MTGCPEIAVTLSGPLYNVLVAEARRLDVSLEWLVASLVAETVDGDGDRLAVA